MKHRPRWLQGLENPIFVRLYLAQTINLVGDSLTWVGLALLAFELAGEQAGTVLAGALTLRVMAFVVLSPIAGAIADRVDRKRLMIATHLARMGIVCLLPFVTQVWQIYAIVLSLNVFSAFFTPTYTATIPLVTKEKERSQAIALSSATYQLLGILGPGLAGSIAAFIGTRQIFFLDGITFLVASISIFRLPGELMVDRDRKTTQTVSRTLQDIRTGTSCLFLDPPIRYALALQLIAAIAGAEILVNTVGYVRGTLSLDKLEYGWVMAAFGMGATVASVGLGNIQKISPVLLTSIGAFLITVALLPANLVNLSGLLLLWAIAGVGQTLVNVPTQTAIADRVAVEVQGRVYGAHFAWSHLWWGFSYPLAGCMVSHFPNQNFFYSSLIGLALLAIVYLAFKPRNLDDLEDGLWHEHHHRHDEQHMHIHSPNTIIQDSHSHLHFHSITQATRSSQAS
ncbi:MFS transporter [Pseudanabaena sp. PCC 6802]|uniref:MFS transporter n=1 Tax=Pseudanabaena sp. PCC 6802 TaxID=118173 RepID=UPI0003664074|nr:MFS transporter [Pseudanabaena sp. PCC 6802]